MAMFENFPYTNLHELNLDWIINELNRIKETAVLSVNGMTGDVILYEDATVQFPNVPEDHWSIIRMANGTNRGIMFGNDDKAYIVHGNLMNELYGLNNQPPYPVTSVNGQTGAVDLFSDNNGVVAFPAVDDPGITGWIIGRSLNNTPCYIQLNDDGTLGLTAGVNSYRVYTTDDTSADVINVPTDASSDTWGLIRDTSEGSVGIVFSNDPLLTQPEAYIRYVDNMDIVHTEKLLTSADIPSASGVVSFNGQTGVVVVKGSDLIISTTDTRTIAQGFIDCDTVDNAIKEAVAYKENTATATQNIPAGAYVIWQNDDYISTQAISIGDTLSGTNLSALNTGGITNNLRSDVDTIIGKIVAAGITSNKTGIAGERFGRIAVVTGNNVSYSSPINTDTKIGDIEIAPIRQVFTVGKTIGGGDVFVFINTAGEIYVSGITPLNANTPFYFSISYITAS